MPSTIAVSEIPGATPRTRAAGRCRAAPFGPGAVRLVEGAPFLDMGAGVPERRAKDAPGNVVRADGRRPRSARDRAGVGRAGLFRPGASLLPGPGKADPGPPWIRRGAGCV